MSTIKNFLFLAKNVWQRLFLWPSFDPEHKIDYDGYWQEKHGASLGNLSPWQKDRADLVLKFCPRDQMLTILDIGCGGGSILVYLKKYLKIEHAVGADVSKLALSKAREQGVETIQLDILRQEELSKIVEADYVLLFEILEHVSHSEELLAAAFSKAKRVIFFSFPNSGFILHRLRLFFGRFPLQWRTHPSEHLRFWTLKDLRWWLRALGYRNYRIIAYRGVPILNLIWPSLFAEGLFVYIRK